MKLILLILIIYIFYRDISGNCIRCKHVKTNTYM